MHIVVLDGYTLNPGDLDWSPLESLGTVAIHDRTAADQVLDRARDATVLLVNKLVLNRQTLEQLPSLQYIGVTATGYNNVDVQAARERDITVTNVKGYGSDSVAQMTFALLLELTQHVGLHNESVRAGDWAAIDDFCYWKRPLVELAGKTLGIVGYGDIGQKVAEIGRAFGMQLIVNRRQPSSGDGIRYVDLPTLFAESDVVTLHCPMTDENKGFVNRELLHRMKPSAFLLNTSRGGLITEADLTEALNEGRLAGAGLDVLSVEPPKTGNPLLGARNVLITPHIAWATLEARQRLLTMAIDNLRTYKEGYPQNVVS
ncbi:D-2-hydroxyacid dehydrogenase [Nibrella saemangeumensis]|uniref:D-2-hydroxyacid dehydrogenase n=1 Tax=Nibrella saemangeumensis TaxID=1084526 RepID=A0ABP8NK57_9BACT